MIVLVTCDGLGRGVLYREREVVGGFARPVLQLCGFEKGSLAIRLPNNHLLVCKVVH